MMPRWRSLLFVAADDHRRLAKIAERGADAVILDLEDAVPPERKDSARAALPFSIDALGDIPIIVRINTGWRDIHADLGVAVRRGVAAIMVPKVEGAERLAVIREMMLEYAQAAKLSGGPGLIALVESPAGVAQLDAIAGVDGVIGVALGSEDFSLALGVLPSTDALDLPCRMLALAAAAKGVMALGLPISIATIDDIEAWKSAITRARAVGITGALCIHPRQIQPVNNGFSPTAAERETAIRILEAWQEAGNPGTMQVDGKMVDRPVILAMRKIASMGSAAT